MLKKFSYLLENLRIFPRRMKENLEKSGGLIFSQRLLLLLINRGLSRSEAYHIVQDLAQKAMEGRPFRDLAREDKRVRSRLTLQEIEGCFDLKFSLRYIERVIKRAL